MIVIELSLPDAGIARTKLCINAMLGLECPQLGDIRPFQCWIWSATVNTGRHACLSHRRRPMTPASRSVGVTFVTFGPR
jgi:hypothetical protein